MTKSIVLGAALATALTSTAAFADVTANLGVASQYLWRGQNLAGAAPAVSGGVDYGHESGLYAGVWTSSEGGTGSHETDYYVGFAGEAGDVSYDVGFVRYAYTQAPAGTDFEEVYISVGFGPASLFVANDSDNDATYVSLTGEYDIYSLTFGSYTYDNAATEDYTHVDISVALTDALALTYSIASLDSPAATLANENGHVMISYGWEFDVK